MSSNVIHISSHFTKAAAQKRADYYNVGREPGPYSVVQGDGLRKHQVRFDRDFHLAKAKHFNG